MNVIIDFDNPSTFPICLQELSKDLRQMISRKIDSSATTESWKIAQQIKDLRIGDMPIVQDFLQDNMDTEVAVCHCTRILDVKQYWEHGIEIKGGRNSPEENRIRLLLNRIGLTQKQADEIFEHIYYLWDRDRAQRTESVHFFIDKAQAYKDDLINVFAINLGGEILRWSISAIGENLYRQEPYKRLWIMGTPSIIKFKSKLSDIHKSCRDVLIAEIIGYFIATDIFHCSYEFKITGMTNGSVPPKDIISIEEINDYITMQEKYPEFRGFYDNENNGGGSYDLI